MTNLYSARPLRAKKGVLLQMTIKELMWQIHESNMTEEAKAEIQEIIQDWVTRK